MVRFYMRCYRRLGEPRRRALYYALRARLFDWRHRRDYVSLEEHIG